MIETKIKARATPCYCELENQNRALDGEFVKCCLCKIAEKELNIRDGLYETEKGTPISNLKKTERTKMTTIKPFYIKKTEGITRQQVQDALDKCVSVGALPFDSYTETEKKFAYNCLLGGNYEYFGVTDDDKGLKTFMSDYPRYFSNDAIKITLDQLDEHLGIKEIKTESDYDKGMREAMKKIAISCGKKFGVDVGYEDLPNLVESLVNPKSEQKEPKFKYVEVDVSLSEALELYNGEGLYFRWLGNPEPESGGAGYDKIEDEHMLACRFCEKRLLKRVELTEEDELIEVIQGLLDKWCANESNNPVPEYLAKSGKLKLA